MMILNTFAKWLREQRLELTIKYNCNGMWLCELRDLTGKRTVVASVWTDRRLDTAIRKNIEYWKKSNLKTGKGR